MIDAPTVSVTLMMLLIWLAHFQPDAPRVYAGACFSLSPVVHSLLFWDLGGFPYYLTGALFNLAVIALLNCIYPLCRTVIFLQRIAFGMILANGAGAALWYYYFEPTLYNWAFVALYGAGCAVLCHRGPRDVGGFRIDRWRACFRFNRLGSVEFMRKIKPEVKH